MLLIIYFLFPVRNINIRISHNKTGYGCFPWPTAQPIEEIINTLFVLSENTPVSQRCPHNIDHTHNYGAYGRNNQHHLNSKMQNWQHDKAYYQLNQHNISECYHHRDKEKNNIFNYV